MAPKQNFRALIQNMSLSKIKNSPKNRIRSVAEKAMQSAKRTFPRASVAAASATEATSSSFISRSPREDEISRGNPSFNTSLPPSSSEKSSPRTNRRSSAMPRPDSRDPSSTLSLIQHLQQLRLEGQTTANMREKMQKAFHTAVRPYEQVLSSASRTWESSTPGDKAAASSDSHSGHHESDSDVADTSASQKAWQSTTDTVHAAALYLDKMHASYVEAKRYYSAVPFDTRWDDILGSLAGLGRISQGNVVVPFHDSAKAFESMWSAVDNAKTRAHWQTYICKDDFVGQSTMRRLVEARKRGCDTELVYDCGGNISGRARLTEGLKQSGANVIAYRPFFRSVATYFIKGLDWRRSPGLRNHRKILLVDDQLGFCGGLNIGNEYCGTAAGGTGKFRDTHCSVLGPAAAHLAEVYRDTKKPHPWKYGFRRWRQITSQQIVRRVREGQARMKRTELYRAFQAERRRGGRRLRSVPSASMSAMRGRWEEQKHQLQTLVGWTNSETLDADLDRAAVSTMAQHMTKEEAEEEVKSSSRKAATATTASNVQHAPTRSVEGQSSPSTTSETVAGIPTLATEISTRGSTSDSTTACKPAEHRKSAMRRKLLAARREALFQATDIPHRRAYTDMLRRMPILDTEPVPEAEMFLRNRPPTTQILSCNARYRDYSIQYAFWQVTRKCHRRIWITTPYYLPTRKLFSALMQAAKRGVDVRLLAGSSQTTDPWFMWHASNYITERLLRSGVKIYEFKGQQIMHAKTVVVDSVFSSIGSYNWDLMSNRNLEVCLCQLDLDLAKEMETQFLRDLAESVEVRLEDHQQRSLWLRFTSWVFYNCVFLLDRITFRSFSNEDVVDVPGVPRD